MWSSITLAFVKVAFASETKKLRMELDEEINDFYEFVMVLEENKNGITFKGESNEYLQAHGLIWKLFNEKGANLMINAKKSEYWIIRKINQLKFK